LFFFKLSDQHGIQNCEKDDEICTRNFGKLKIALLQFIFDWRL